jgi:hypothetical protein
MSKIKINKADPNRILLTELLPYEVPMLFSNDGYYNILLDENNYTFLRKIKSLSQATCDREKRKYGIPFIYEIKKSVDGDSRILSVIHPLNQYNFIEFYQKYDSMILHLCSKSPFTLRRPSKIAKYCYSPDLVFDEDELKNEEVEIEPDILDQETKYVKSYFTYHPIDLIYKFYNRNEYQRLEQRFSFLLEFDINKCFYNLYTHSITWAVKDKESAKRNSRKISFENTFDKLMQLANYNETNGILVGPEISRIFAEIILQQIDLNVLKKLEKEGIVFGVHYEVRRYVDDYFVFSNDDKHLDIILKTFKRELEEYKLYINSSKTNKRITPFITNIAVGKREIDVLIESFMKSIINIEEIIDGNGNTEKQRKILALNNPYGKAQSFIKDFQCIVKRNNLTYDILSKEVVRKLKRELVQIFKNDKSFENNKTAESFLLMFLDIIFYTYSLNINSSTTFKVAQVIVLICKYLENSTDDLKHTIFTKIAREADFVITIFQSKTKPNETNVETLNLLIALKKIGKSYLLSEKRIRELFGLTISESSNEQSFKMLNYFQIVTLLYYFGNNPDYELLKNEIENAVIQKYSCDSDPFTKAELTMLFFDYICCPFVSIESKKKIIRISKYSSNPAEYNDIIQSIQSQNSWFMSWNEDIDLERILKKKEWSSSY